MALCSYGGDSVITMSDLMSVSIWDVVAKCVVTSDWINRL